MSIFKTGLEGDMYQLSHLLSEQRSLLTTLASTSIFHNQEILSLNDAECSKEDEDSVELKRKQALSDIAEKIEGCVVSPLLYYSLDSILLLLEFIQNV